VVIANGGGRKIVLHATIAAVPWSNNSLDIRSCTSHDIDNARSECTGADIFDIVLRPRSTENIRKEEIDIGGCQ
jgi:hypothetical protein